MRRLVVGILALLAGAAVIVLAPDMGTAQCVAGPAGTQFCETKFQAQTSVIAVGILGFVSVAAGGRIVWTELV